MASSDGPPDPVESEQGSGLRLGGTQPAVDSEAGDEPVSGDDARSAEISAAVPARRRLRRYIRTAFFTVAAGWLVLIIALALTAPWLPIPEPDAGGFGVAKSPLDGRLLGTDQLGRDMVSRVVYGARMSLLIAGASIGLALSFGVAIGLTAGYIRGKVDPVVTAAADVILAFPGLVLLMVVAALMGASPRNLIMAIAILQMPTFVRLARASTISLAQREFILAAKGSGARAVRISVREILPNVMPTITAYALAATARVFVIEGSLSFLGLGIQPPTPAWGSMIAAGRPLLVTAPHIVLIPATALFATVLAFNTLADTRRDAGRPSRLIG